VRWIVVAALAGAAAGQVPPVIHEPFTPLPCPLHPDTTLDVEGCQELRVLRTDRAIDAQVKIVFRLIRGQSARASFVDGERSWLRYRRGSCLAESSAYAGGTEQGVALLTCSLRENRAHLAALAATRRALSRH
jgi:uncharacterized protein YecT (DUF1311 family)